jgi:hypothetical protein
MFFMMYFDFKAGDNEYKLRLNTRNIVTLEKTIECNPLMIFGKGDTVPTISTMVAVLHASLQQYHHGVTVDKAFEIFDAYLADGNAVTDFIPVILEIYKVSGLMKEDNTEKN